MAKTYLLDSIKNFLGRIKINHIDGYDTNGDPIYYAVRCELIAKAETDGVSKTESEHTNYGDPQSTPFTDKDVYKEIKKSIGNPLAKNMKDLFENLIDEDVSEEKKK